MLMLLLVILNAYHWLNIALAAKLIPFDASHSYRNCGRIRRALFLFKRTSNHGPAANLKQSQATGFLFYIIDYLYLCDHSYLLCLESAQCVLDDIIWLLYFHLIRIRAESQQIKPNRIYTHQYECLCRMRLPTYLLPIWSTFVIILYAFDSISLFLSRPIHVVPYKLLQTESAWHNL